MGCCDYGQHQMVFRRPPLLIHRYSQHGADHPRPARLADCGRVLTGQNPVIPVIHRSWATNYR
jgi:hypothetical protein